MYSDEIYIYSCVPISLFQAVAESEHNNCLCLLIIFSIFVSYDHHMLQGILHSALHNQYWRLIDPQGKPTGVMGWWPSRAVTFLENHDTGSTQVSHPVLVYILILHFMSSFNEAILCLVRAATIDKNCEKSCVEYC